MKFILVVIFCSGLEQNCLPPQTVSQHSTWYDCMMGGYSKAQSYTKEVGMQKTNEYKLYVQFQCRTVKEV